MADYPISASDTQPPNLSPIHNIPSNMPVPTKLTSFDTASSGLSKLSSLQAGTGSNSSRFKTSSDIEGEGLVSEPQYGLYKRRWFGLAELTLLSFATGWGYAAPGVVSTTATKWYGIDYPQLNWLGIASSFIFLVPAPFTIWVLNRFGPKYSIMLACFFSVLGHWIIYAGARSHTFPVNIAGTVIHSLAAPFVLAAPTRYSRQWFDDRGRTLATALPSLAYPLGAGVGALSGAWMVKPLGPLNYDGQALIVAIVFTAAAFPSPFLPRAPPSPPSVSAAVKRQSFWNNIKLLARNPIFYLQLTSFSVFAGTVDTLTGITNQAIAPYGYPQLDAGYAIAFLIFVGVVTALLISPILDRTKTHLIASKVMVLIIAASVTALPFVPQTRSKANLYAVYALIGASSLSIEPCVLEFQAAWTHPVSPEFSSVICWAGAKVMGGIFTILAGNVLVLDRPKEGQPEGSLYNGLIFLAVMCWVCVPGALVTGYWKFKRPAASIVEGND